MNRFSPSEAALEGFRLTRERWSTILTWSGVYFVGLAIIAIVMSLILGPKFIELAKRGDLSDPEAVAELLSQSGPAFLLLVVMVVGLMSVLTAGIYRIILRPEEKAFAYLRLGPDELRLTAVNLLLFGVGMACLAVGVGIIGLAMRAGGVAGEAVAAAAVAVVTVWIGVRLSMATPMTFNMKKVSLQSAWKLSRGSFWRLFGMIVLAVIFYMMILLLITIIGLAIAAAGGGQKAMADLSHLTASAGIALVVSAILQQILSVLQLVMIYAPFAVAYEQLHGDVSVDPLRPAPKSSTS